MSSKPCDSDSGFESATSLTKEERFSACWERCVIGALNGPRGNRRYLQKLWADVGAYLAYVKERREARERQLLAEEWAAARGLPPPPAPPRRRAEGRSGSKGQSKPKQQSGRRKQ